jgi:alkanesulfonate monooxygenase SsuD/methylene tetrahydromethanopterin reductase-like flavin-dependent oxidoreductase (luciferase family)
MAESTKTSGRRMKIGLIAGLEENSFGDKTPHYRDLQALAQAAEQVGFDSFWLADRAPRSA